MTGARTSIRRPARVVAGLLTGLLVAGCGTPRLGRVPQPDADLSGRWVLESGDDAARLIAAALPKPRKPPVERERERDDPNMMPMPRGGDGGGARRGGGRGADQAQGAPRPESVAASGRLSARDFVAAFVMPPQRLDVVQQPALMRVGAGDRPRVFEPGDEEPVTVTDRYGSRAVRAGWIADAFVINSDDGHQLHVVEQLRRDRDGRLERTVEFNAPSLKTLKVRSLYRRATPAELDVAQADGPPSPVR